MKHIAILIIGLVMLAKPAHALGSGFGEEFDTVLDVIDRCFKNFNDEDYDFCTPYGFTYKTIETETQSRFGDVLKFKTDIIQAGDGIRKYKHNNVTLRCNGGCNSASEVKSRVFEMMAPAHANSGYTSTLTMLNGTAQRGSANRNNGRDWSATLDNAESALDIGAQLTELLGAFGSSQSGRNYGGFTFVLDENENPKFILLWDSEEENFKMVTDFTELENSNGSDGLQAEFTASFNIKLASAAQLVEFLNVSANAGMFGVASSNCKIAYTGNEERMSAQVVCF